MRRTGARSVIYLAVEEATRKRVAIKRAVFETQEDRRLFEQVETEYKVSKQLDHPYIRKCHELIRNRKLLKTQELMMTGIVFSSYITAEQALPGMVGIP